MIEVSPLHDFEFSISEFNRDKLASYLKEVMAFPRLHKIVVHNKTKTVKVACTM